MVSKRLRVNDNRKSDSRKRGIVGGFIDMMFYFFVFTTYSFPYGTYMKKCARSPESIAANEPVKKDEKRIGESRNNERK